MAPGQKEKAFTTAYRTATTLIALATARCGFGTLEGLAGGPDLAEDSGSDPVTTERHDAADAKNDTHLADRDVTEAPHNDSARPLDAGLPESPMEASSGSDVESEGAQEDASHGDDAAPLDGNGGAVRLPIADAFVRGGTYSNDNYGTDGVLYLKNATAGTTREAYLTFDLSGMGSAKTATLRLAGSASTTSFQVAVSSVADTSWSETLITWSNRPARGALLSTVFVQVGPGQYDFDVTSYVSAELAAGRPVVSFGIYALNYGAGSIQFNSRESSSSPPLLLAVP